MHFKKILRRHWPKGIIVQSQSTVLTKIRSIEVWLNTFIVINSWTLHIGIYLMMSEFWDRQQESMRLEWFGIEASKENKKEKRVEECRLVLSKNSGHEELKQMTWPPLPICPFRILNNALWNKVLIFLIFHM